MPCCWPVARECERRRAAPSWGERGVSVTVANVRRIKPLPEEIIAELVATHATVVTVEENALAGGFGSAVLEVMQGRKLHRPLERVCIPDRFIGHGAPAELHRQVGFTGQAIAERVTRLLGVLSTT